MRDLARPLRRVALRATNAHALPTARTSSHKLRNLPTPSARPRRPQEIMLYRGDDSSDAGVDARGHLPTPPSQRPRVHSLVPEPANA